jgi:hypothetical protein
VYIRQLLLQQLLLLQPASMAPKAVHTLLLLLFVHRVQPGCRRPASDANDFQLLATAWLHHAAASRLAGCTVLIELAQLK